MHLTIILISVLVVLVVLVVLAVLTVLVVLVLIVLILVLVLIIHDFCLHFFLRYPAGVSIPETLGLILGFKHKACDQSCCNCRRDSTGRSF